MLKPLMLRRTKDSTDKEGSRGDTEDFADLGKLARRFLPDARGRSSYIESAVSAENVDDRASVRRRTYRSSDSSSKIQARKQRLIAGALTDEELGFFAAMADSEGAGDCVASAFDSGSIGDEQLERPFHPPVPYPFPNARTFQPADNVVHPPHSSGELKARPGLHFESPVFGPSAAETSDSKRAPEQPRRSVTPAKDDKQQFHGNGSELLQLLQGGPGRVKPTASTKSPNDLLGRLWAALPSSSHTSFDGESERKTSARSFGVEVNEMSREVDGGEAAGFALLKRRGSEPAASHYL
ncbi:hypothetical protein SELMODRAFT_430933 [Selaginella moellendorffii]|uniref:Uncharacterized protein n=1 Tax=Selaginella moellendorffii TaxID=88036 RepID=D8TB02_SELML|nr:hypothetical protein SELMODRAFT_430933 [Selaginella moellendorffii]